MILRGLQVRSRDRFFRAWLFWAILDLPPKIGMYLRFSGKTSYLVAL
ncbi:hypothetical protein [Kamptonema sp. UHCC 0994]|nr:hypothetical protein [Kamptonema sp. UHCC 0994]MDF0551869.1 hypothetical protein [Kamptonema sp. UHCC 0994]